MILRDEAGHDLAIAGADLGVATTTEQVGQIKAMVARLRKKTREVVAARSLLMKPLRGQVAQVIHEQRMAEAAARERAHPAAPPAVRLVATGHEANVRAVKARYERSRVRSRYGTAIDAGSEREQLADAVLSISSSDGTVAERRPDPADLLGELADVG